MIRICWGWLNTGHSETVSSEKAKEIGIGKFLMRPLVKQEMVAAIHWIVPLTDKLTAQRLMRHKDGRSTDNYYHAYSGVLMDVVQKMDNIVDINDVKNGK